MITTIITYQKNPLFKGGGLYECSHCHARNSELIYDAIVRNFAYCPFCGAKILGIQKDGG